MGPVRLYNPQPRYSNQCGYENDNAMNSGPNHGIHEISHPKISVLIYLQRLARKSSFAA